MLVPNEYKGIVKSLTNIPRNYKEYLFDEYMFADGIPPERFKLEFQILRGKVLESFQKAYDRMFLGT